MSTTSGLGGIFGFEVVCRDPLGTCSFAGLLECGGLSLGGMLVVCRGAVTGCPATFSTSGVLDSAGKANVSFLAN